MLSPPHDLPIRVLVEALASGWRLPAASVTYRPAGFGSHSWEIVDTSGVRWFGSVDEPTDQLVASLRSALDVPVAVAPVLTGAGEPLTRAGRYAVALYPFVDGESFHFGDFPTSEHRRAALDLVIEVHGTPPRHALVDDLAVEELPDLGDAGPYSRPAARPLADHGPVVERLRARCRALAATVDRTRDVLTHGEPHPGNTMRGPDGWRLIDWGHGAGRAAGTRPVAPRDGRHPRGVRVGDRCAAAAGGAGAVPPPLGLDRPGRGGAVLRGRTHGHPERRHGLADTAAGGHEPVARVDRRPG